MLIHLEKLGKSFGEKIVLHDVTASVEREDRIGIVGQNGAGKTTLLKILTGEYQDYEGEFSVTHGVTLGYLEQNAKLDATLDLYGEMRSTFAPVLDAMAQMQVLERKMAAQPDDTELLARHDQLQNIVDAADGYNMDVNIKKVLSGMGFAQDTWQKNIAVLSGGELTRLRLAKLLLKKPDVLILDEPTSSLDDREVEKLFTMMRRLKEKGVGIIFVTHFLEQVYAVCDGITVLRNGQLVGEYEIADLPRVKLVAAMMGKDFDDLASIKPETTGDKRKEPMVIEARGLSHAGTIKPFDLDIHKGEVIGLTGLLGSGRSELARTIYGADRAQTGTLKVKGKEVKVKNPIDAMHLGMGLLPDDRKAEGIVADLSVRENIILAIQAKQGILKKIPMAKQCEIADKYIDLLQIKCASRETLIKQLSGGNQQKVILARWLATNPDFLILDEPTRGIDIGTKTEIQKLVLKLADEGKSLIFISSEIEEMLRTCNRMAVLRDGQKVGEIDEADMNQMNVMKAIAGGEQ